jgi:signal transduction histidine kinase
MEDPAGMLWIGTNSGGLDAFEPKDETFIHFRHDPADPHSLSSDRVRWIHQDRSGTLWVGTRGGGAISSDPALARFSHYRGDPDDPQHSSDYSVLALHEDKDGLLWIGAAGGGLDVLDRKTGEWRHYPYDPDDPAGQAFASILAIHEDPPGIFWLGTDVGFYRFAADTGRVERLPHNPPDPGEVQQERIYSIDQDREGVLWLGTHGRGLSEFDPVTGKLTYHQQSWDPESPSGQGDGLSNNWVHEVVEDDSGNLWIATQEGLCRYDRQTNQWDSYRHDPSDPHSLSHNWLMSLHLDQSGVLWIGTLGGGLDSLVLSEVEGSDPASGTFSHYTVQDGLANSMVLDILEGGGSLWVCTANGLSRYDPRTETFQSYNASDGLPINEFSTAHASESGELLAGGAFAGYRLRVRSLEARSQELEKQVDQRTAELRNEVEQRLQAEEALRQRERERAVTEERNRLARELHDSVTQALYGVSLYSQAASGQLALGRDEQAAEHLENLQDTAQQALAEMRLLVFELRPPILEEQGLVAALQVRLQAVEGRAGLRTEFRTDLEARLPLDVEEGLYRIALEALNNALKHARAQNINVYLRQQDPPQGTVALTITDDGAGFDPATARQQGGLGLLAMKERAEAIGAALNIGSETGNGTKVSVVWRKPE